MATGVHAPLQKARLTFRASLLKIVFGGCIAVSIPFLSMGSVAIYVGVAIYLAHAVVNQILVLRMPHSATRTWISGIVDLTFLTFMVHRVGATATALVSLYVLFPALYALVGRARVALWLGVYGAAGYAFVLLCEYVGWLPAAPDLPPWAASGGRPLVATLMWASVVSAITFVTTTAIYRLARTIEQREAELVRTNAELEELAVRDPLTGLFNRRHLHERINIELARVRRGHGTAALLLLDLDRFKQVNDDLGHQYGDLTLRVVGQALQQGIRETDSAGRYGGDEFVVVLSNPQPADTAVVAERLLRAIREVGQVDEEHQVTASLGVANAAKDDTSDSLIARADANVYRAKKAGGDQSVGP